MIITVMPLYYKKTAFLEWKIKWKIFKILKKKFKLLPSKKAIFFQSKIQNNLEKNKLVQPKLAILIVNETKHSFGFYYIKGICRKRSATASALYISRMAQLADSLFLHQFWNRLNNWPVSAKKKILRL